MKWGDGCSGPHQEHSEEIVTCDLVGFQTGSVPGDTLDWKLVLPRFTVLRK